jgi:hypothetical protein
MSLLEGGDAAVLGAPQVDFARELKRMGLVQPRFEAQLRTGSYSEQTIDAESGDLRAALKSRKTPEDEAEQIIREHRQVREKLSDFLHRLREYRAKVQAGENGPNEAESTEPRPEFPALQPVAGLPQEFADYFTGAIAWHNPALQDKHSARESWQHVLELPPAERKYKSVWAAFMLGKSWEKEDPDKATSYFKQVRLLAKGRYVDSGGLATASLGLEARVHLKQKQYQDAIDLYLAQLAAGDETAIESLRMVASEALDVETPTMLTLAKNPHAQRVLTTYISSLRPTKPSTSEENDQGESDSYVLRWLDAAERAEIRDAESAEKLALAAYQHNELKLAGHWIERAPGSPIAAWLRAKLLVHDGKVDQAASLLARVASSFPLQPHNPTNELAAESLKDTLFVCGDGWPGGPAERQVLGELGILRLTRREYVQALDALLNAGFWEDAAYVAERVLTLEELKAYVDRAWFPASDRQLAEEEEKYGEDPASPTLLRKQIRYLLARRLTREIRGDEAREYYPSEWLGGFDTLAHALRIGWDESQAAEARAQALFEAAAIAHTNGMELLGTELEPDWHICEGECTGSLTVSLRASNPAAKFLVASTDEIERGKRHSADPEARFHYRYQAASLAWEAANLLPNDSDQTAYVLWSAGSWLKTRNPHTADLFYKALVRRNRHTLLGAEADHLRWFPRLDENGKIIARAEVPRPEDSNDPNQLGIQHLTTDSDVLLGDEVVPDSAILNLQLNPTDGPTQLMAFDSAQDGEAGQYYTVQKGDSLASILRTLQDQGLYSVSFEALLGVNPELDPTRLKVGQKLYLPALTP